LAVANGQKAPVFLRVASLPGKLYVDLGTADWSAIEITDEHWSVVPTPPVRFRRSKGMLPLPAPEYGGSLDALNDFIHPPRDARRPRVQGWVGARPPPR